MWIGLAYHHPLMWENLTPSKSKLSLLSFMVYDPGGVRTLGYVFT